MISIVTAFYDIGRSDWKALPRSVDTYFSAFERMCKLDNDIILFTAEEFRGRIESAQRKKGISRFTTLIHLKPTVAC